MARQKISFEEELKTLEEIVESLDSKEVTLDELMGLFENGVKSLKQCHKALSTAQGKITKLVEGRDGELVEKLLNIDIQSLTEGFEI